MEGRNANFRHNENIARYRKLLAEVEGIRHATKRDTRCCGVCSLMK
jgi:hypothetical protein